MTATYRAVVLARRPQGDPVPDDFAVVEMPVLPLSPGEFRTRNLFVSLDAGFRNWMNEGSGDAVLPAMPLGQPVMGLVLAEVSESRHLDYRPGERLMARFAWEEQSVSKGADFIARLPGTFRFSPSAYLGVLGDTGMSAWFGIEIGAPVRGETVLISAAGGAVGSIAGQLAKLAGARTVGIVGNEAKGLWLVDSLGYDAFVVRGVGNSLVSGIQRACPAGVDLYFDNVGGAILEAAITCMNECGRIVMCGAISGYGATTPQPGPANLFDIVLKQLKLQGFMTHMRHDRYPEVRAALAALLESGKLRNPEHMLHGIAAVPAAFADLFSGRNLGKTIVTL